jgi:hypothetical protein
VNVPSAVVEFERFLDALGLVCEVHRGPDQVFFGNRIVQYGRDGVDVGVRIVSDRSIWSIDIAETATRPGDWYDVAIIRDLLLELGDDVMPLDDQIAFAEANWSAIIDCFDSKRRAETHVRLARLKKERAERLFPNLKSNAERSQ